MVQRTYSCVPLLTQCTDSMRNPAIFTALKVNLFLHIRRVVRCLAELPHFYCQKQAGAKQQTSC